MVKIIAFDTETTGISPVNSSSISYNEKREIESMLVDKHLPVAMVQWNKWAPLWPSITQLSYIVYDTEYPEDAKIFNKYIDLPVSVEIDDGASKVTHMYKSEEDAVRKGVDPETPGLFILSRIKEQTPDKVVSIDAAMQEFMSDMVDCQYIVAHNVDFDKKMILAELHRLRQLDDFTATLMDTRFVCTMYKTIQLCKITTISKRGTPYYKFPKLSEAYETLFGYKPVGEALHNAVVDVVLCLRIFCKLESSINMDIHGTNEDIMTWINSISPLEHHRQWLTSGPIKCILRNGKSYYK